jgi:hypothetical protein
MGRLVVMLRITPGMLTDATFSDAQIIPGVTDPKLFWAILAHLPQRARPAVAHATCDAAGQITSVPEGSLALMPGWPGIDLSKFGLDERAENLKRY